MYIGYSRVSTSDQNPDLQLDALKKEECHQIFSDTASGSRTDRPGLDEALAFLREDDTLVVWKLDRLGRSLKHLIEVVNTLKERGIYFKSIQESIDTSTSGGKLIFHVFGALAESEQGDWTSAGMVGYFGRIRVVVVSLQGGYNFYSEESNLFLDLIYTF